MKKCILCGASKVNKYYACTDMRIKYKCNCLGNRDGYYNESIGYYIIVNSSNIIEHIDIGFDDIRLLFEDHVMYYKNNIYSLDGYGLGNFEFKEDIDYLDKIVRKLVDNLIFM